MGSYLQVQNRLDLAERSFETAVKYGQVNLETWHLAEIAEMATVCLALTQQIAGRNDDSREVLLDALERFPDSVRIRRHLIDLVVKLGRTEEALKLVSPMATMSESDPIGVTRSWEPAKQRPRTGFRPSATSRARTWEAVTIRSACVGWLSP